MDQYDKIAKILVLGLILAPLGPNSYFRGFYLY